jgi:hypothetical protein
VADDGLAGSGKFRAAPSEVLVEAADDDDGQSPSDDGPTVRN